MFLENWIYEIGRVYQENQGFLASANNPELLLFCFLSSRADLRHDGCLSPLCLRVDLEYFTYILNYDFYLLISRMGLVKSPL